MVSKPWTIEEAYEQVIARLRQGEKVSPDWLRVTFGPEMVHRAGLFMDYLVAQGLVTRTVVGRKIVFSSNRTDEIVQLLRDKEMFDEACSIPQIAQVDTARKAWYIMLAHLFYNKHI